MNSTTIALDIGKNIFQLHGVDGRGKAILPKQLKRGLVLAYFANLPPFLVRLKAYSGSITWPGNLSNWGMMQG